MQRSLVDGLDLVGREQRHRRVGIAHAAERQLRDRSRSLGGTLGAAAASCFGHAGITIARWLARLSENRPFTDGFVVIASLRMTSAKIPTRWVVFLARAIQGKPAVLNLLA